VACGRVPMEAQMPEARAATPRLPRVIMRGNRQILGQPNPSASWASPGEADRTFAGVRLPSQQTRAGLSRALSRRVVEREATGLVVVGEQLGVACPARQRPQGQFGILLAHVVLELIGEAAARRHMAFALVENLANVCRQRYVARQLPREHAL